MDNYKKLYQIKNKTKKLQKFPVHCYNYYLQNDVAISLPKPRKITIN